MTGNVRDIGVTYLTFGICIFTAISILSLFEKRAVIAQRVCSRVKRVVELPEGSKRSYITIIEIMTVRTGGQNLFHHDFFFMLSKLF